MFWLFFIPAIIAIPIIIVVLKYQNQPNQPNQQNNQTVKINNNQETIYKIKNSLLTNQEKNFYKKLLQAVDYNRYIIQPQVNLASIIEKMRLHTYANELFRNIDFVIFDLEYKPLIAIELNDITHKQSERYKRDLKVRQICSIANLPLITFYANMPNEIQYLQRRIAEFI